MMIVIKTLTRNKYVPQDLVRLDIIKELRLKGQILENFDGFCLVRFELISPDERLTNATDGYVFVDVFFDDLDFA